MGLLNKPLPAFLAVAMLAGVALCGPRRLLRNRYVWLGAAVALALWSPWLAWQAAHGWPQLAVSRSIAAGGSASSAPWWQIVPFQVLLAGPLLAPVWIAGLVRLFRDPALRELRFLAWAWALLAVVFMATGGKPYYLAGLLPALLGAGAVPVDHWLDRGRHRARAALLGVAVAASALAGAVIALPVLPARDAGPVIAVNPDVGETIGWPDLVATVAGVRQRLPRTAQVVILTENYGEAGAIDRFGPALRPAPRLQRAQRLRPVGSAAAGQHCGHRRRLRSRPAGQPPARLHPDRPHQQRRRRRQRRGRQVSSDLPRPPGLLGPAMARPASPGLTTARDGGAAIVAAACPMRWPASGASSAATPARRDFTGRASLIGLLLEGVLDFVPRLLEVPLGLVGVTFGFQFLIVGGLADAFLDLALDFRGLVSSLILSRHDPGTLLPAFLPCCPDTRSPNSRAGILAYQAGDDFERGRGLMTDAQPVPAQRTLTLPELSLRFAEGETSVKGGL